MHRKNQFIKKLKIPKHSVLLEGAKLVIICLEGAPAVGKSTTAQELAQQDNFHIIPEVNSLFHAEESESPYWYYEKQVERWSIANAHKDKGKIAILDGDVFQPLWFKWLYPERVNVSFQQIVTFYRQQLAMDRIGFPDRYVLLTVDENERERREINRGLRSGRAIHQSLEKVNRYREFSERQSEYFEFLNHISPNFVVKLEAINMKNNVEILNSLRPSKPISDTKTFETMVEWFNQKNHF